jgi:hypothetical protein
MKKKTSLLKMFVILIFSSEIKFIHFYSHSFAADVIRMLETREKNETRKFEQRI